jgi:hypothetical protein
MSKPKQSEYVKFIHSPLGMICRCGSNDGGGYGFMSCDRLGEHIEHMGDESEHEYARYYTCDGCLRIIHLKTGRVVGKAVVSAGAVELSANHSRSWA